MARHPISPFILVNTGKLKLKFNSNTNEEKNTTGMSTLKANLTSTSWTKGLMDLKLVYIFERYT